MTEEESEEVFEMQRKYSNQIMSLEQKVALLEWELEVYKRATRHIEAMADIYARIAEPLKKEVADDR